MRALGKANIRWIAVCVVVGLITLVLGACAAPFGAPAPTATETPAITAPTPTPTPMRGERSLPAETPTPLASGEETVPPEIMELVKSKLAAIVRRAAGDLQVEVVEIEYREWPDSSLGCPQRGRMYLPVVTPGYRIVLRADGQTYEFHTDAEGKTVVLCEPGPVSGLPRSPGGDADMVAKQVVRAFAGYLGVDPEALEVVEVTFTEWPDASLGCPDPNKMYAQVITLGYRIVVQDADGTAFELHTNLGGTHWVWCENGKPRAEGTEEEKMEETSSSTLPERAQPAFEKAKALVAEKSGLNPAEVELKAWESVTWPDSSLGCPEPGKVYLQVLTPGYRFVFQAGNTTYEVHTDERGRSAVMCGSG